MAIKVRDVIRRLEQEGWVLARQTGSHRQYTHPTRIGRVTIAGHPGDDLASGTFRSIERQAGWR